MAKAIEKRQLPPLVLGARIVPLSYGDIRTRHLDIDVFQNGGKAGVLTVEAEYADAVVAYLNACSPAKEKDNEPTNNITRDSRG